MHEARGCSPLWPIQGCASGQGMVFVLSVLNREYNFERVFPYFNDRLGSSSCESRYDMRKIVLSTKFKTLAEAYSRPYLSDLR